jgi:hypothetical protein
VWVSDDVNLLGGSVHTVKENAEALLLLVATKEIGLEVNAGKTKYMVMSRDRNAGRGHSRKIDNSSIEGWKSSNIWKRCQQIKILFRRKLGVD